VFDGFPAKHTLEDFKWVDLLKELILILDIAVVLEEKLNEHSQYL
jgi:hypothetical protein